MQSIWDRLRELPPPDHEPSVERLMQKLFDLEYMPHPVVIPGPDGARRPKQTITSKSF